MLACVGACDGVEILGNFENGDLKREISGYLDTLNFEIDEES